MGRKESYQQTPHPICNSSLNFLVQESHERRPREIFMHKSAIGWRHCCRAKIFYLPSRESNPGCWIYRQTFYHITVKAGFYCRAVELYLPRPCDIYFTPVKEMVSLNTKQTMKQYRQHRQTNEQTHITEYIAPICNTY